MKYSKLLLVGVLVTFLVPMLSCSKSSDNVVLAEFKDRKVTLKQFETLYARVSPEYLPQKEGIDGLKDLLTTIVNKEIMAYKADELGYDKDQTVIQGMEAFEKMGLQAAWLNYMVAEKVKVTEDQVRDHYKNKAVTLAVKVILCDTPAQAEEVYGLLKDGADFESVCKEYSKSPDAAEGGRVVTAHYGGYAADVQRELFNLPIGGITKPVPTPYGFHIMKVLRRTEARVKEPYEQLRASLEEEIRQQNQVLLQNELTEQIRQRAGVEWYWDNFQYVLNALPPDRSLTNPPSRRDEVYPLLYFEPEDMDKPLVSYNDVTITIKDFSDYYDRSSFFARPRREFRFGGIKQFLMERVMGDLVPEEMERSNIDQHPEVVAVMKKKREEFMVNRLYEDLVNQQTVVTAEMVRNYYKDNTDKFKSREQRRFGIILCADHESAQAAYKELQGGARFRNVARTYSTDEPTRDTLGESDLLVEGEQPELDRVGFALKNIGDVSEPFETSRGWMILKLTERTEARTFTEDEARDSIQKVLKQTLNEERLNGLLDKWREELGVKVYPERLAQAKLPDRSAEITKSEQS